MSLVGEVPATGPAKGNPKPSAALPAHPRLTGGRLDTPAPLGRSHHDQDILPTRRPTPGQSALASLVRELQGWPSAG